MRIAIASLSLALLVGCGKAPETAAPDATASAPAEQPVAAPPANDPVDDAAVVATVSPGERVTAFLAAYHAQMFRGLPTSTQATALAEHFSPRLNGLLSDALAGQQAYKTKYPTDKPPMIDGDIFSSLFEGATSGTVEAVEEAADSASVRVNYVYSEPGTAKVIETWPDRFLLVRGESDWLIDDIEYLGGWDFAPKGKLSSALAETAALRE